MHLMYQNCNYLLRKRFDVFRFIGKPEKSKRPPLSGRSFKYGQWPITGGNQSSSHLLTSSTFEKSLDILNTGEKL